MRSGGQQAVLMVRACMQAGGACHQVKGERGQLPSLCLKAGSLQVGDGSADANTNEPGQFTGMHGKSYVQAWAHF